MWTVFCRLPVCALNPRWQGDLWWMLGDYAKTRSALAHRGVSPARSCAFDMFFFSSFTSTDFEVRKCLGKRRGGGGGMK